MQTFFNTIFCIKLRYITQRKSTRVFILKNIDEALSDKLYHTLLVQMGYECAYVDGREEKGLELVRRGNPL